MVKRELAEKTMAINAGESEAWMLSCSKGMLIQTIMIPVRKTIAYSLRRRGRGCFFCSARAKGAKNKAPAIKRITVITKGLTLLATSLLTGSSIEKRTAVRAANSIPFWAFNLLIFLNAFS